MRQTVAKAGFDMMLRTRPNVRAATGVDCDSEARAVKSADEIHEVPYASKKSGWAPKPGMFVTIKPGIYREGNLGVRIEDLVLVSETGCEVLTTNTKEDE